MFILKIARSIMEIDRLFNSFLAQLIIILIIIIIMIILIIKFPHTLKRNYVK